MGPRLPRMLYIAAAFFAGPLTSLTLTAQEVQIEAPLAPQPPSEPQAPAQPEAKSEPQEPLAPQAPGQDPRDSVDAEAEAFATRIDLYNRRAIEAIKHGQYDSAREILRTAIAEAPNEPVLFYNLGCVEALAGNPQVAISALSNAVDLGFNDIELMNGDPDLTSLRKDPEFRKLYQIVATNSLAAESNGGPEIADIYKLEPGEGVKEEGAPQPVKAN